MQRLRHAFGLGVVTLEPSLALPPVSDTATTFSWGRLVGGSDMGRPLLCFMTLAVESV